MDGNCFNCSTPTSLRRTLVLSTSDVLEDPFVCEECLSTFREVEWIEVA